MTDSDGITRTLCVCVCVCVCMRETRHSDRSILIYRGQKTSECTSSSIDGSRFVARQRAADAVTEKVYNNSTLSGDFSLIHASDLR